ncbi:protein FAM83G-like isoform X3 [Engraulis encrasicolus]|uniref:protein FAM83G-like isoform X3 n=1 Tax=Engraulis encrasicolus TaxID=184585 RepID=UPI002FD14C13
MWISFGTFWRRRVAVYIVIDTAAVNQFLHMCTRASMHTGHLQFLRVRSTGGSEFYTRSAQLICGTLAQRFLLVDGDKAISGSYSFTWSASRLDRNLITVLSGQAVETFDRQFRDLWLTSRGVSLSSIPLDELPAPDPAPAPAPNPVPSAAVARKMINPKYALVSADTASRTSSDKNSKNSAAATTTHNALQRANRAQRGGAKLVHTHPGLLGLAKADLVAYLPIWPEPDPPSDVIGYINIRDVSRPAPAHLMRSQLAETSQAIRFSRPLPTTHTDKPTDPQTHTHTDTHTQPQTHIHTNIHPEAQTHTETHTRNDAQSGTHTDDQRKTQSHTHSSSSPAGAKTNTHTHTHTPHTQQSPTPDTHTAPVNTHAQLSSTHTSDTHKQTQGLDKNTQQTHTTEDKNTSLKHTTDTNTPLSHPSTPPTPKPRTVKLRLNSDGTDIRTHTRADADTHKPSHTPHSNTHKSSHTPRARRQAKPTHTHKASAEQTHTARVEQPSSEHMHSSSSEEYEDPIENTHTQNTHNTPPGTHTHHEDEDDDMGVGVVMRGQGSDASEEFYDCDSADATSCHGDLTSGDTSHDDHTPSSQEPHPPADSPFTQRLNLMARLSQSMLDLRPQPPTQCFKSSSRSPGRESHGRVGGAKVVIAKPGGYIGSGAIGRSPASRNTIGRSPACRPVIGGARYWQDRLSSSGHASPTHTPQDVHTHAHTRYGRPVRRQTALFAHSSCSPTRRYGAHTHALTHAHTHTQSPSPARRTHTNTYYRRGTHTLSCPPTARHTHTISESPSPRAHSRTKAATATGSRGVAKATNSRKKGSAGHKK